MDISNLDLQKYTDMGIELSLELGGKLVSALLVLWIGFKVIKIVLKGIDKIFEQQKIEKSLRGFLDSLLSMILKGLVLITAATMIGVEMTSFIAIIGAMGLAVGLALQGSLANFAGGVLILLLKPFRIGHFIESAGFKGTVKKIEIFSTTLKTIDNKIIHIPNGILSNGAIQNYSEEKFRRIDFTIGIGYGDDIQKTKKVLLKLAKADKRILDKPATPMVGLVELADSSVNFTFRVWVEGKNYWDVFFGMNEKIKETFDAEGISFPFPQREVHLVKE